MTQQRACPLGHPGPGHLSSLSDARAPPPPRPGSGTAAAQPARLLFVAPSGSLDPEIAQRLRGEGHAVMFAESGEQALGVFEEHDFELVLLDVALPGLSGFDTCRLLRARSDVAIVFLTAAASLPERLLGFDLGADDYVTTPTELSELDRRIRAVLWRRRGSQLAGGSELHGPASIVVRLRSHEAFVGTQQLFLTPKEFALLRILLEHRGEVLSSDEI